MRKLKTSIINGEFCELPSDVTAVFMKLVSDRYDRGYDRYNHMRYITVVEYQGDKYIAATSGYVAVFYPLIDDLPLGDYEGLPYMRKVDSHRMQDNLDNMLKGFKDHKPYRVDYFGSDTRSDDDSDIFDFDCSSSAKAGDYAVVLGRIDGERFSLNDKKPYQWIFDEKLLDLVYSATDEPTRIYASKPNQAIIIINDFTGVFACLMPMIPDATVTGAK